MFPSIWRSQTQWLVMIREFHDSSTFYLRRRPYPHLYRPRFAWTQLQKLQKPQKLRLQHHATIATGTGQKFKFGRVENTEPSFWTSRRDDDKGENESERISVCAIFPHGTRRPCTVHERCIQEGRSKEERGITTLHWSGEWYLGCNTWGGS